MADSVLHGRFFERDNWPDWSKEFWPWVQRRFDPSVLARFHEGVEPTWIEWLDQEQAVLDNAFLDSATAFRSVLTDEYDGVRVYHATRQRSLDSISRSGLRAWSGVELSNSAHATFNARANRDALEAAIGRSQPDHRGGWVYTFSALSIALNIHDGLPGSRVPCFAKRGGEFLDSVSVELGIPHVDELRAYTKGYLLACDVPWDLVPKDKLDWLARESLATVLTSHFCDTSMYNMVGGLECISFDVDLPPQSIVRFAEIDGLVDNEFGIQDLIWRAFIHPRP